MFNPNLLCTQFGIKVGASKTVGCGFGGARLNLPELGSEGKVSGKFSQIPSSGQVSAGGSGWEGIFQRKLGFGVSWRRGRTEAGAEDKIFFFPPCSD